MTPFGLLPTLFRSVQISTDVKTSHSESLKGQFRENQCGLQMFIFWRRQLWYHLFGCETLANRAITAQSWDYLVYLHNLTVHKDQLPQHRMTSQSALLL